MAEPRVQRDVLYRTIDENELKLDAYLPAMQWATLRAGIRVCVAIGVGLAVLALAATALHLHEFTAVRTRILARFRRSNRP